MSKKQKKCPFCGCRLKENYNRCPKCKGNIVLGVA